MDFFMTLVLQSNKTIGKISKYINIKHQNVFSILFLRTRHFFYGQDICIFLWEKESITIHVTVMTCISITPHASTSNHVSKIDITPCQFCKTSILRTRHFWGEFASTKFETTLQFFVKLEHVKWCTILAKNHQSTE